MESIKNEVLKNVHRVCRCAESSHAAPNVQVFKFPVDGFSTNISTMEPFSQTQMRICMRHV